MPPRSFSTGTLPKYAMEFSGGLVSGHLRRRIASGWSLSERRSWSGAPTKAERYPSLPLRIPQPEGIPAPPVHAPPPSGQRNQADFLEAFLAAFFSFRGSRSFFFFSNFG